ncbi:hypothetical protein MVEN_00173600 [Mycena venus]|uniref:F-box domain-containing protein n=1 Tax=Mycena venus TaxID=2733690 RepID=A0A8H6Z029_9AGAR|nr:hypothetical protein MVEN_00173600 [Mycena venus]
MALASLADLPNELLVDILDQSTFPTEALYYLALLSRRLHFVALPIYFSRTGIDLETRCATIALASDRLDPLSALQICLFLSSMDTLVCIFPHPSCITISPFLAQLKRLQTFISRLSSIKSVTLNLDSRPRSQCLSVGIDEVLDAWASQYGGLLNCIVEKGCSFLAVKNGTHLTEAYESCPPGLSQKYLPRPVLRLFATRDARRIGFRRSSRQGTAEIVLSWSPSFTDSLSQLTSLYIHSVTLLVPPGLDWTLSALRHSPITSLTICMSPLTVERRLWATVLPLIAAAAVNVDSISLTEVDPHNEPEAYAFLARLPRLTDLTITPNHPYWGNYVPRNKGPIPALTRLVNLHAPASVIDDLVSRAEFSHEIRTICVHWRPSARAEQSYLVHSMSSLTTRLAARRLTPRLSLHIDSASIADTAASVVRNLNDVPPACFKRVESLCMEGPYYPVDDVNNSIPRMVSLFPDVAHVSLQTPGRAGRFSDEAVQRLVCTMRATETLRTVEVNGKSYPLSNQLSDS